MEGRVNEGLDALLVVGVQGGADEQAEGGAAAPLQVRRNRSGGGVAGEGDE